MTHYAILGDGRLARHMRHYLALSGQAVEGWARNPASHFNTHQRGPARERLKRTVEKATHVMLLVSDDAITPFLSRYPFLHEKTLIHCAGALNVRAVAGAHPLMTFADSMYTLEAYRRIPFMVETGYDFKKLFPELPNPVYTIRPADKALYHALCVVAGNFPQMLWQAVSDRFANDLGLPHEVLGPYLEQVTQNAVQAPERALTGPLSRGDEDTVRRHLAVLENDSLQEIYRAFVDWFKRQDAVNQVRERAS